MEYDQVLDFVNTINGIRENFCTLENGILTITTTPSSEDEEPVSIETSDIESIELTKHKFTGTEVFIRSISGSHILAFAFANQRESVLFDIKAIILGFYQTYDKAIFGFLLGAVVAGLIFTL